MLGPRNPRPPILQPEEQTGPPPPLPELEPIPEPEELSSFPENPFEPEGDFDSPIPPSDPIFPLKDPVDKWLARHFPNDQLLAAFYKREPYHSHKDHVQDLENVFAALSEPIPYGGLVRLSTLTNIKPSTLSTWRVNLMNDPSWRPSRQAYARRTFSDAVEEEILNHIVNGFIEPGVYFCDQDFITVLQEMGQSLFDKERELAKTEEKRARIDRQAERFTCSPHFVRGFRRRHRLALRRPSFKRRPTVTQERMDAFMAHIRERFAYYPADRILNMDETHWKAVAAGFLTWAVKGAESVTCHLYNDEKEGVTVIAAITAAGDKLPLTIVGKGKTPRCLAGYCMPQGVWGLISLSGWTTADVMKAWLNELRDKVYPDNAPVLLIMDTYAAHRGDEVRGHALALNIDVEFIPPGCTDRLQPLDRQIFGILKGKARGEWRARNHTKQGKISHAEMLEMLVRCWNEITPQAIATAWDIYTPVESWGDEEDDDPVYQPHGSDDEQ